MKTKAKAIIERGDRKWVAAEMYYEPGDVWAKDGPGGRDDPGDPGGHALVRDHIAIYISGTFVVRYPGRPELTIVGPSLVAAHFLTGDKRRYPKGRHTVTCVEPGVGFFLLPRGAPVDLDYALLLPDTQTAIPRDGWALALGVDPYVVHEIPAGVVASVSGDAPTLVFWEE